MKSILTVAVFYILAFKAFAASPVAPAPAVAKPIDIPLTYWIHESCNNKGVDLAMDEAKDMYKSALIRLQASERNQLRAFEMIFKFHPSQDQARANMIQSVHFDLARMTRTGDMVSSNYRIYCDGDPIGGSMDGNGPNIRWVLVPDRTAAERAPGELPNSQQPMNNLEWREKVNLMRGDSAGGYLPGCARYRTRPPQVEPDEGAEAWTFWNALEGGDPRQPRNRAVVSLCDHLFQGITRLQGLAEAQNWAGVTTNSNFEIDDCHVLLSLTLAHELAHHPNFAKQDFFPLPPGAPGYNPAQDEDWNYGWRNIVDGNKYPMDRAIGAAESYPLHAMIAKLADQGIVLAPNRLPVGQGPANTDDAKRGLMVYDGSTPQFPGVQLPQPMPLH